MNIGSRHESDLHRELKNKYTGYSGKTEIEIEGFVCDGLADNDTLIEVQLNSFAPLLRKAEKLCVAHRLLIVHPVVQKKTILTFDKDGNLLLRRASPRKGSDWDLFKALVYAPLLPLYSNVSIELVRVEVVETRIKDGRGSWRRKGVSLAGKRLVNCLGAFRLNVPADYLRFLPFNADEMWTSCLLAKKAGIRPSLAQKTLYVLFRLGLVEVAGKDGRARLWAFRNSTGKPAPRSTD
ncbi:MAG: hypothetical protein LBG74_00895 [Spirochaetaceae bacterium]|jgi:hypothetical protein|nr:hypothetical protein [Spirochaetaceae bacterium]